MTMKEFSEKYLHLNNIIDQARGERDALEAKYIAACPLKAGDKVRVHFDQVSGKLDGLQLTATYQDAYIKNVEVQWNGAYKFNFNEVKANGEQSNRRHYIYSYTKIEKLS